LSFEIFSLKKKIKTVAMILHCFVENLKIFKSRAEQRILKHKARNYSLAMYIIVAIISFINEIINEIAYEERAYV